MAGNKKIASGKPDAVERAQQARVHRLEGAAGLTDDVVVMVLGEAEVSGASRVDLLDKPGGVQPAKRPVDGNEAQIPAERLSLLPDLVARSQVPPGRQGPQDRQPLGRHFAAGISQQRRRPGI